MYKVIGQVDFVRVGMIRRHRAEPAWVGRAEADPRETVVSCPKQCLPKFEGCRTRLHCEVHRLRQVHPNRGTDDSVQLLPFVRLLCLWSVFGLNRVYLTLDYEIILHLLLPEVEVRIVELP